jgi:ceramide glucosyltransferase
MILAYAAGWTTVRDPRSLRLAWLYPVRDLMGFGFWCASFFGRMVLWRGERYRLEHGGLMVPCAADLSFGEAQDREALPTTVPADQLS